MFPYFGVETARSVFFIELAAISSAICYIQMVWIKMLIRAIAHGLEVFFLQWAHGGLLIFDHFPDAPVFTSTVLADAACAALFFPHAADGFF